MTTLWSPTSANVAQSNMTRFVNFVEQNHSVRFHTYADLYDWSIHNDQAFWDYFWDFAHIQAHSKGETLFKKGTTFETSRFFPQAYLNYAQNLLRQTGDTDAIIF